MKPGVAANGTIPEEWIDLQNAVPIPMAPGDIYIMHRLTKHASLPNRSRTIRWSFDLRYMPIGLPTGRPMFPGFVGRSRANPSTELTSHSAWQESWHDALSELIGKPFPPFNRWSMYTPVCA